MPIQIHGKLYTLVNERVLMAHEDLEQIDITTEVLFTNPVVVKATVKTKKGIFNGISAANPAKTIEKQSPYEVAETSAIGRALGFAGYGIIESIASADEMVKADKEQAVVSQHADIEGLSANEAYASTAEFTKPYCPLCMKEAVVSKTKGTLYCPNFKSHPKDAGYIAIVDPKKVQGKKVDEAPLPEMDGNEVNVSDVPF